jgi:hypothetical protein
MPDRSVAAFGVLGEQFPRFPHQIVTEAFELIVVRIDQRLKVSLQVARAAVLFADSVSTVPE